MLGSARQRGDQVFVHVDGSKDDPLQHAFDRSLPDRIFDQLVVGDIAELRQPPHILRDQLQLALDELTSQHAAGA